MKSQEWSNLWKVFAITKTIKIYDFYVMNPNIWK